MTTLVADVTHVRSSVAPGLALCGVVSPNSSVSEAMVRLIAEEVVPPFGRAVTICLVCRCIFEGRDVEVRLS